MRDIITAISFSPNIENIIRDMQFSKDAQLKRCVAAAYLALIQTPYNQQPKFYEVDKFYDYPRIVNAVGLCFKAFDGRDIGLRISNDSEPQYIYDSICELMGLSENISFRED